jgi:tRNA G18 (ribose-2'-O)-methylase SpoU
MSTSGPHLVIVDDPDDGRVAQFRLNERGLANRAAKRDDAGAGLFLAEGDLVVERALDAGCAPVAALVDVDRVPAVAARLPCPIYGGGLRVRQAVAQLGVPASIIALFRRPPRPGVVELAARADRLVVGEAIDNPANVGSIVRSAAALGWDGLILDHTSADPLARRSLRVAMGTAFELPHARTSTLAADLAALDGFAMYALTPDRHATPLDEIDPPTRCAVLLGAERTGLGAELLALAEPVRIPMAPNVDSLNVGVAAAIACWALRPSTPPRR